MTEALKPCPFCGGKDIDGEMHTDGRLHCYRCGANGPAMPYAKDDKFPTWNTRADLVDPAAIREAVAEYVRLASAQMVQGAVKAEREACAVVADILETEWWGEYKNIMSPHAYDPQYQGMSDGAGEVAAAIRARGEA